MSIVFRTVSRLHSDEYFHQYSNDVIIKNCVAIFQKPNHVYRIYSELHTGQNAHSGKRYFRWQNSTIEGIRRNKNGNIVAYALLNGKNTTPNIVWSRFSMETVRDVWSTTVAPFQTATKETFGIKHWHDVYPVAKHYELVHYSGMPKILVTPMRAQSSREFVEQVYGKKNYRKDLLKAVGGATPNSIAYSREFRGLVPTDWIINFLRYNRRPPGLRQFIPYVTQGLRNFLTQIDSRSYRHLLVEGEGILNHYLVEDVVRLIERNGFIDEDGARYYRSWEAIHDRNMPRYNRNYAVKFEDCEINLLPIAKKLNGLTTKSFEIVTATNTTQLTEWGQAMHNCIGGYRSMAVNGQAILGGIYSKGKLIANFELDKNKKLKQLLGVCNKPLGDNQKAELEEAFKSQGVDVRGYWGKNGATF